jgi:DAACS family dicarboxylate/amino acid:cation (Na+ or H+) symporter
MIRRLSGSFVARIGFAAVMGIVFGLGLGPAARPLGDIGKILIQLIKMLAVPLLFLAVVDALATTHLRWKSAVRMLGVSVVNTSLALGIGLALSHFFQPGRGMVLSGLTGEGGSLSGLTGAKGMTEGSLEFAKVISGFLPSSVAQPFVENAMIPLLFLAILLGAGLRHQLRLEQSTGEPSAAEGIARGVSSLLGISRTVISWVVAWVPLAVFGVLAKTVGESGMESLSRLPLYLGVALLGLGLQVFVVYSLWIRIFAQRSLREFWRAAREPVAFALGASSSLASLPVTLKALDRLRVSPESARMSACVGTNFNNDGILLYEAMAVLFVAQAHGLDLSVGTQMLACLACVIAGFGISGIPDAGLVSLAIVLSTVGLPTELLPVLLSVDWILSRARAMTNVIADITGGVILDAWDARDR